MSDRDQFAAAALAGLLAAPTDKDRSWEYWARIAYEAADAMLAERAKTSAQKEAGSGSVTPEPVAWAVVSDSKNEIDCEFVYQDEATAGDVALDANGGVVPLYAAPQPTLTDAEREAIDWAARMIDDLNRGDQKRAATLRGLLERLK